MSIDEILEQWDSDSYIDETTILYASIGANKLHHKYITILAREKEALLALQAQATRLSSLKRDYYLGLLDAKTLKEHDWIQFGLKIPRSNVHEYVNGDEDVIKLNLEVKRQEEKCGILTDILKIIHNRSFHLNNAIAIMKFKAGEH